MDSFDDSKKFVSVYNEAALQINRLDEIWNKCHKYAHSGNLNAYKWQLDRAWVELSADAKKLNEKYYFNVVDKINNVIAKANNSNLIYILLQKKEIFLRELQEDAGKGGKRRKEGGSWY